jgi:alpha-beta hydrolase superfamily lysophospholipase
MSRALRFSDEYYDGQMERTLAAAYVDAADFGEALAVARRIRRPNPQRWHRAWSERARTVAARADESLRSGELASARTAFLRASEYHRQSYFFLRHDLADPRLQAAYRAHVETFRSALELMSHPAETAAIPYASTQLKGYFYAPDSSGEPRPTVLLPCGYDSTAESGWSSVPAALQRGYNAFVFEGPGQGAALYEQGLVFRPDFEHVLTPTIDWLIQRSDVEADKLILIGRSFAGYLAPRAATVEHRISVLVCDPAQPDLAARLPGGWVGRFVAPIAALQMRLSQDRAEFFGSRIAAHGISDVAAYIDEMRRYTMLDRASEITCPTLAIECEGDFVGGGGQSLVDAVSGPAELIRLSADSGAGGHCGGLGQRVWEAEVYGWIGRVIHRAEMTPDTARV